MLWRKGPSTWVVWGVAWVILGMTLVFVLPASATFSIPFAGSIHFERFVDPDMALFWRSEPGARSQDADSLVLVDLATGTIQEQRFRPSVWEPREFPPIPEAVPTDDEESESGSGDDDGISGELVRAIAAASRPSPYPRRTIIGDALIETRDGVGRSRMTVWNWRTGKEQYVREIAGWAREIGNLGSERCMMRIFDPASEDSTVELFELASGHEVPTTLPKNLDIRFPSPDGRWLLRTLRFPNNRIEVWNVERGTRIFTVDADLFEYFPDSRRLATVVHRETRSDTPTRMWQIHDLEQGAIVAERRETLPTESILATELIVQGSERILAFGRSRYGNQDSVDIWSWNDDRMTAIRARQEIPGPSCGNPTHLGRSFGMPREPDFPPRFVVDGRNVIDLATRRQCGTLPPEGFSSKVAPGWAIVDREPGPIALWLAKVSRPLARPLFRSRLVDLSSGKPVATLTTSASMATFSPNGRTLIETGADSLTIWKLPPSRPFLAAFLWSLACPLLAGCFAWIRARRGSVMAAISGTENSDRTSPSRTIEPPLRRRKPTGLVEEADDPAWLADPTGIPFEVRPDLFSPEPLTRDRDDSAENLGVP